MYSEFVNRKSDLKVATHLALPLHYHAFLYHVF